MQGGAEREPAGKILGILLGDLAEEVGGDW